MASESYHTSKTLEICIVGFGAIGTVYGWLLDRSKKVRITAVCRSNFESLKEQGVDIESLQYGSQKGWKPYRVVRTVEEAADTNYDYIIGCFKAVPDVQSTPKLLGPLLEKSNTFVLIQNGINIERDLQVAKPSSTVISGCAWIDCTLVENYRILRHGNIDRLVLGVHEPLQGTETTVHSKEERKGQVEQLLNLFKEGGANHSYAENIVATRWRKNLWNAAFSTLATLSRANMFEVCEKEAWKINKPAAEGCMKEVVSVARQLGITEELLPSTAIHDTISISEEQYHDSSKGKPFKPSMLVDLESGRPMEVVVIVGEVVNTARKVGVEVPRLEMAYAALNLLQQKLITRS
ncbi:6-phosphogluconate dehydrogenase C-terminal domain-like protein [Serendipita vermifera]|nr:6-phosphogluconate dehydrogenase C-terminal domain-like protein [Serendipita vermifera]